MASLASQSMHFGLVALLTYFKFLLHIQCVHSVSPSIITDKEALISFKSQLSSVTPSPLSSWNKYSSSPCNWTGVVCNTFGRRATGLDLSGQAGDQKALILAISPSSGPFNFKTTSLEDLFHSN
ncbi:hypothetical protein LWI28_004028 [Acer negundo]|uniref:Leucine-rich repeat-containing N-terminal plant-type domain-containing protein n=1 Tax=Acer negundo TaxID=4023 RepID=A0AAD5ISQ2_ACENE|nr:hypothetical protein LWI28_004028 [Acer negundo]KAK4847086.1 hypothetical protein QYF36_025423 [Acer negundo]